MDYSAVHRLARWTTELWAQEACPDKFVAVAGFGDFGMDYLCTDPAYADRGGYKESIDEHANGCGVTDGAFASSRLGGPGR